MKPTVVHTAKMKGDNELSAFLPGDAGKLSFPRPPVPIENAGEDLNNVKGFTMTISVTIKWPRCSVTV